MPGSIQQFILHLVEKAFSLSKIFTFFHKFAQFLHKETFDRTEVMLLINVLQFENQSVHSNH